MRSSLLSLLNGDASTLSISKWNQLMPYAKFLGVLGRVQAVIGQEQYEQLPEKVCDYIQAENTFSEYWLGLAEWESMRLRRVLGEAGFSFVLLKGAAYHVAKLEASKGRFLSDIDILVPVSSLNEVELVLKGAGWQGKAQADYNDEYYRRWMHEVPPLRHEHRQIDVDLHHNIIPPSSRYKINAELLISRAKATELSWVKTLAPEDMVLHNCLHLFVDSDFDRRFRDLMDFVLLVRQFQKEDAQFFDVLAERAIELRLLRPLYYSVYFSQMLMKLDCPESFIQAIAPGKPNVLTHKLMTWMVPIILLPAQAKKSFKVSTYLASKALYIRSHWLRMPPLLLMRHLLTKAKMRALAR